MKKIIKKVISRVKLARRFYNTPNPMQDFKPISASGETKNIGNINIPVQAIIGCGLTLCFGLGTIYYQMMSSINFMNNNINSFKQEMNINLNFSRQELNNNINAIKQEMNSNINEIKQEMNSNKQEMNSNINAIKQEMNSNINAIKQEMNSNINEIKQEMNNNLNSTRQELILRIDQINNRLDTFFSKDKK
jgi:DNA anti-recombination protein RmuC